MAIINAKATDKYGVIHTTNINAVRTGKMKAQYSLNATDFATKKAENGMLLVVDNFAKEVKLPTDHSTTGIYVLASEIKDYEGKGEASYAVDIDGFKPRMLALEVDDEYETNCVEWDDGTYATFALLVAAIGVAAVYGETNASGNVRIVATATAGATTELKAIEQVTLPNGELGIKFAVNAIG